MPKTQTTQTNLSFLLKELIQFRTVTADQNVSKEALNWFEWQMGDLPIQVTYFEQNGYTSLFTSTRKTKKPKLLLMAHVDVVPGSDQAFQPLVKNGRLYGRGTFDMKFAIACYLKLMLELGDDLPKYDLGIMINSDEEDGGFHGAQAMSDLGYGGKFIINPDAASDWDIEAEAKSHHMFVVESFGKSAHASRTWEGINAIDNLMDFLRDIKQHFPSHEPCGDTGHRHDVCTVATIKGGDAYNQIPRHAVAEINIRTMPGKTGRDLEKLFARVQKNYSNIVIGHPIRTEAFVNRTEHPGMQLYSEIVQQHTGRRPRLVLSHATSDARYYSPKGVPVLVSKPVGGPQHAEGEWIDLKSLETYYAVLREFVERFAKL